MFLFLETLESGEGKWAESLWPFLKTGVLLAGHRDVLLPKELFQPQQFFWMWLVLIYWVLPVLEASCWSMYLCVWSWVCAVELKIQCTRLKCFKTLLTLASECVSKDPPGSKCPQPTDGKEWDRSSRNMKRWKCRNLQCRIGLREWEEAGEGCTKVVQKVRWLKCSAVPSCNSIKPQGLPL